MTHLRYVVIKNKSRYLSPQEKVTEISILEKGNVSFLSAPCIFNEYFSSQLISRPYLMNVGKFEGNR